MRCTSEDIEQFILESDRQGGPSGPACQEYWSRSGFERPADINQELDPFSEAYVAEQVRLYEQMASRRYDAHQNEQTSFDLGRHISAVNPYDHPSPEALAIHLQRLTRALRYAKPVLGEHLLDMGCGWGLSSEVAAYLGLRVTAVDVNQDFVELVAQRAKRSGLPITAVHSTFEAFAPQEPADLILFYECLHHAVRPWSVIESLAAHLKPGGRIVLAGEPINEYWWKNWGLRLDPISVYCIRKFGWFESGWSLGFIRQVFHRAHLTCRTYLDSDPEVGYALVAEKTVPYTVSGDLAGELFNAQGTIIFDRPYLVISGEARMQINFPPNVAGATFKFVNFRARDVRFRMRTMTATLFDGPVAPGAKMIEFPRVNGTVEISLSAERWVPSEELPSEDRRGLGLHLEHILFR